MRLQLIIVLVMALLLVVFTFQNPHPVQMHFVGWGTKQFPVIGVILISILAGVVVATIIGLKSHLNLKSKLRDVKRELNELKVPPVKSDEDEFIK